MNFKTTPGATGYVDGGHGALEPTAGGGLLSRRHFLSGAASLGGAVAFLPLRTSAADQFDTLPSSWKEPGGGFSNYGQVERDSNLPIRWISNHPAAPGDGVSWTPHHQLEGTITPNGLHFERHHNGIPAVAADQWEIAVHGRVDSNRAYSLDDLLRMPMETRQLFVECGGNSNALWREQPVQTWAGYMHGLVSCSEWTGVRLSTLLDYSGVLKDASWVIADGLDGSGVTVSIPLTKALDDVLVALYQNGEPVRPAQGFPARLVVPGWEGITHVKWLRNLMVSDKPLMSKFDTVSYTDLQADGSFERFSFAMGVKSFITSPSPGYGLTQQGIYEIKGLAWSGAGRVAKVEVSADGGKSWGVADIQPAAQPHALARFRIPWHWQGQPATLMSRATDETGAIQPTRDALLAAKGANAYYHFNGITLWSVSTDGDIAHVYG